MRLLSGALKNKVKETGRSNNFGFLRLLFAMLVIGLIAFGVSKTPSKQKTPASFFEFLGICKPLGQIDRVFFLILIGTVLFTGANVVIPFYFSPTFKALLLNENSPFIKISNDGFGFYLSSNHRRVLIQSGGKALQSKVCNEWPLAR